ncbi:hypothetical protein SAMN04488519_103102 [Algoriphagus ornithinivorans]|uniref:Outer membrane protein beta-barrel domain-containing protein n=1 Tax=Algoriphagus ornithinivorans TaxID=226506 RepID=A0A1I5DQ20_9BACT|nr:hypothetical protein [Algoriphagus ornithinivorans]SFO01247.1 hypothetical protein SAMN04488519_103102 [Algoriphagus ornithinivorans]
MRVLRLFMLGILTLGSTEISFGQKNWEIEAKIGTGNTNINTGGNYSDLELSTNNQRLISFGLLKKLKNNFSFGVDSDIYRFQLEYTFLPLDQDNKVGTRTKFWSIGPKLQKDIYIKPKLGLSLAVAFHLTQTNLNDEVYTGIWQTVRLPGGGQPIPVLLYGNKEIEKVTFHLKPEGGIFYDITESSRITFSCEWGINLREPTLVVNLDRIVVEDQTFQNRHILDGNYFSAQLGYRYSF